ncbi:uncharacterized protein LOC112018431 [Quercus suber]|uniref:uncharacterized protein LOC112018431 n=1 Tax=Quercus suber TaxID=58331 RepID=UPI000CE1B8C7|nr:uncharacterized protein LOC112018431 [Quercus suber]
MYKLNFNADVFANREASGVGVVIHNMKGEVMVALSTKGSIVGDSEEAKALACRKALEFAMDAGFLDLIIEGGNVIVMQSIFSTQPNLSWLGLVYKDICCILASLQYVYFSCVCHSANLIAHSLACYASQIDNEIVWMEEWPPPTFEALFLDSSFLNE